MDIEQIKQDLEASLTELNERFPLKGKLLVIGCSTSEVIGKQIGKAGSPEIAEALFDVFDAFRRSHQVDLAFQGCEHINRALTLERQIVERLGLEAVTVVPVPEAGGSMASVAYQRFSAPVVVETIQADAGIYIGDTFIGMHLKPVAIPVRLPHREIGEAHVTAAVTRPKLIGGARAKYE
ncbi:TIGR01440 family protein [Exiguobacterium antarcticum]|uniref:TIGR01440 family protein n=1 Tax=Exiguobacterium antarcticum TaxID=132920 RepID=UPI000285EB8F|nr:TIGR01440 family protein [Exiguobacterium antarcticum]AFS71593.1 Hypothetical protein Eab7_2502 [Exiguobacterium antarcticum B7]